MYNSEYLKDSIVFIDEIDSTKERLLRMIVENDVKMHIDVIKLFLSIHFNINNITLPAVALQKSRQFEYSSENINNIIEKNKNVFEEIFEKYNMSYLFRTSEINDNHAFLFYDNFIRKTIIKNQDSRKSLVIKGNNSQSINEVKLEYIYNNLSLHDLLADVNYAINHFVKGVSLIASNYFYLKNEISSQTDDKFHIEDSVSTVISSFNIPNEFHQYLVSKVIYRTMNLDLNKINNKFIEYIHIQDSPSHDYNSHFYSYKFGTLPEDLMAALALKTKIIGLSATATIDTVVGNYVLNDLKTIFRR
jgi:hypothetical protein